MPDRERLIELIREAKKNTKGANCDLEREMLFAEYLLANGVTISKPKTIRPPADLKGKCGSCIYAKPTTFGSSKIYVECTNAEHIRIYCSRHENARKRQKTARACKRYEERVDEDNGKR